MEVRNMHIVKLNDKEVLRPKLLGAYEAMEPKNVRYLCKLSEYIIQLSTGLRKPHKHCAIDFVKNF